MSESKYSLPFQTINTAVKTTGLSENYLRMRVRNNDVPFIKSGNRVLLNVPALLKQLERETGVMPRGCIEYDAGGNQ